MALKLQTFVSRLAIAGQVPLHLASFRLNDGKDFWCLMLSPPARMKEFAQDFETANPKPTDYGQVLYSGFGQNPPEYILKKLSAEYKLKLKEAA